MPVETVLPLCSLSHFFPMTDLITFSSFQPEGVPLLRKKESSFRYAPHPIASFMQAKNRSIRDIIEMVEDAAKIAPSVCLFTQPDRERMT